MLKIDAGLAHVLLQESALCGEGTEGTEGTVDGGVGEIKAREPNFFTADAVLNKLERVLKRNIQLPGEQIQEILTFLENQTVQSKPISPSSIPAHDEDDQWVLASALAAKADVFVTGDKDLLDVANEVSGITITDPRGFWGLVKKRPRK
jgi:putative PIN family toxin of toxin-antitoxin system